MIPRLKSNTYPILWNGIHSNGYRYQNTMAETRLRVENNPVIGQPGKGAW